MKKRFLLKELSRYRIGTWADIIYRNALLYPDRSAFKCGDEELTFSQFNDEVNRLIRGLQSMDVRKGDFLGVLSWNCMAYAVVYGAAMKGGFIAAPINPRLKENELENIINHSGVRTIFVGPQFEEIAGRLRSRCPELHNIICMEGSGNGMLRLQDILAPANGDEPDIQVAENDPLFLFYTSGTTGTPRGALYSQERAITDTMRFIVSVNMGCDDIHVMVMPFFHVGGAKFHWSVFYMGGMNIIMPQVSFSPSATLQTIQDEKATIMHIVPTHLAAFLGLGDVEQYDLSSIKSIFYAASPMPLELLKKGMKKWGPVFVQSYGATETGPFTSFLSKQQHNVLDGPSEEQEVLNSAGRPCTGVHVRIIDALNNDLPLGEVGEIIVHSKSVMEQYWLDPEKTEEVIMNGWIHTGDMGRYDESGNIYIVDRKKDMIISGGENIFSREVEEVLYQHPAVNEAAVIGVPDPYWVEKVHAVVVLQKGQHLSGEVLINFCKERLAPFKAPKSVAFVASLPKTPSGKILKRKIKETYREKNI